MTPFKNGVSVFLKAESKSGGKKGRTTGLLSAGLESWKLVSMLVHIMFSIGLGGDVVPNSGQQLHAQGVTDGSLSNVTDVIQSACASCFEMHMALDAKEMHVSELEKMGELLSIAKYHHLRLSVLQKVCWELRDQKGKGIKDAGFIPTLWKRGLAGNKHHYIFHLLISKLEMGCNLAIVDTELSESSHKEFVKTKYPLTSKRRYTRTFEMAQLNVLFKCIRLMKVTLERVDKITRRFKPPPVVRVAATAATAAAASTTTTAAAATTAAATATATAAHVDHDVNYEAPQSAR